LILNNATNIGYEWQKWNIFGEQQGTLFLTTIETRNFRRSPCYIFRSKSLYMQTHWFRHV
jgi:hypothetical protein